MYVTYGPGKRIVTSICMLFNQSLSGCTRESYVSISAQSNRIKWMYIYLGGHMYCEAVRVRVFFGWSPVGPRRGPQKHIYVLNSVNTHAVIFLPVASKGVSAQHCRIPISRRHYSFSRKRSNFDLIRSSSSLNREILKFVDCHFL